MSHRVVFGGFVVSRICGSSAVPGTQQIRIQLQELCRYSRALNHSTNSSFEVCLGPASSSFQHCDICIPLPPAPHPARASHPARCPQALEGRNCIPPGHCIFPGYHIPLGTASPRRVPHHLLPGISSLPKILHPAGTASPNLGTTSCWMELSIPLRWNGRIKAL